VPAATYRAAVKCLVSFDERANLGAIGIPILCLATEHDRNAPAPVVEKMAGKIPGAYYLCLPGLGICRTSKPRPISTRRSQIPRPCARTN